MRAVVTRSKRAAVLRSLALLLALAGASRAASAADLVALPPQPAGVPYPSVAWPEGDAAGSGADVARLSRALDAAFADPDPERPVRTRAVVVVRGGRIVAERYAPGFDRETRLLGWSMTKSVLNALAGLLVADGRLDLHAPVDVPAWRGADDPRRAITADLLLRASSGLAWNESYEDGPIRSNVVAMLYREGRHDMAGFAARRPLAHPPGTFWQYSSGSSLVLSGVVRAIFAGDDAAYHAYPRRKLFAPLGMQSALLEADASGTFVASSYSWATARDWARFGLLYLRDGHWEDRRVLPEGWVDYSRTPTPTAPHGEYGAHFWLNAGIPERGVPPPNPRAPRDLFAAQGHEGQIVAIVPSRDLVLVRLGLTPDDGRYDLDGFVAEVVAAFPPVSSGPPGTRSPPR